MKRHICFVAPRLWPVLAGDGTIQVFGGAEVQQTMLIRVLARGGYRISVISMDFGQPDRAMVDGVRVHKTFRPEEGLPVLRFLHPRLTSTWRALKEVDADIYYVRAASMLAGVVAGFARRYGRRSIYAAASDADFVPGHRQIRFVRDRLLYEHGLRKVDQVVAQNAAQVEACLAHYGRRAALIPSSYELPAATTPTARDCVVWAGRVHPEKRAELFVELAQHLPQRKFVLIGGPDGDEPYYQRIRAMAAVVPNLECTGYLPLTAVEPWFDRARVVVNTSTYEGMPNTFLQAWARGVPTVATVDIGVPVQKVVSQLEEGAREVERLFTDQAYWAGASRDCKAYFERVHSSEAVLERYTEVFEGLYR